MAKQTNQFKVIIEQDEEGYLVGSVPGLPGCHTQAKTLNDLKKRIREAISLCLDLVKTDPQYRQRLKQYAYEPSFVGLELVQI